MQSIGQRGSLAAQTGIEPRQSTGIGDRTRYRPNPYLKPKTRTLPTRLRGSRSIPAELSGRDLQSVKLSRHFSLQRRQDSPDRVATCGYRHLQVLGIG